MCHAAAVGKVGVLRKVSKVVLLVDAGLLQTTVDIRMEKSNFRGKLHECQVEFTAPLARELRTNLIVSRRAGFHGQHVQHHDVDTRVVALIVARFACSSRKIVLGILPIDDSSRTRSPSPGSQARGDLLIQPPAADRRAARSLMAIHVADNVGAN